MRLPHLLLALLLLPFSVHADLYVKVASHAELDGLAPEERITTTVPEALSVEPAFQQQAVQEHPVLSRWIRVKTTPETDARLLLQRLSVLDGVEQVEVPPVRQTCGLGELDDIPTDPLLAWQWYLEAVEAYAAWDLVPDASDVIVSVVDIGTAIEHLDLADVLWTNTAEAGGAANSDDDGNGYIDDIHGYNVYNDQPDPSPASSSDTHGTHVAGTLAAAHNDSRGIAGMAPGVRLMAVRAGEGSNVFNGFDGVLYAAINGADVIVLSWGGFGASVLEHDIVRYAVDQGCILVAAAGN
ncbi:S8 family serine peptidase, partial [bacterium]|nr:S8 family serine peptidase [bacterium]